MKQRTPGARASGMCIASPGCFLREFCPQSDVPRSVLTDPLETC